MRIFTYITTLSTLTLTTLAFHLPSQEILNTLPSPTPPTNPCTLATSPTANASIQLSSWLECQINAFYPYPQNTHWPTAHSTAFSRSLRFTFNNTHYDYTGSLSLYTSFNATLGRAFTPFKHGFTNTLAIPNANGDKGGFVYMIGWAGGYSPKWGKEVYFTNAAFAVVGEEQGERKIVEFRESSNIPNSARLPEENVWQCKFNGKEEGLGEL